MEIFSLSLAFSFQQFLANMTNAFGDTDEEDSTNDETIDNEETIDNRKSPPQVETTLEEQQQPPPHDEQSNNNSNNKMNTMGHRVHMQTRVGTKNS